MKSFKFVISTPNGNLLESDVLKVFLRGANGDLSILANHALLVTVVKPCQCQITFTNLKISHCWINRGFLSVIKDKNGIFCSLIVLDTDLQINF